MTDQESVCVCVCVCVCMCKGRDIGKGRGTYSIYYSKIVRVQVG